jgi:hypothetical protein
MQVETERRTMEEEVYRAPAAVVNASLGEAIRAPQRIGDALVRQP